MNRSYRISFDAEMRCDFDDRFLEVMASVEGMTALSFDRMWTIYTAVRSSLSVDGVFVECGVDRGGSAKFISGVLAGSGRKLHLFDTFTGMPKTEDIDAHTEGDFPPVGIDTVRAYVGNDDATYHVGLVQDTLPELGDTKVAFAHVDCDLHSATKACCEHLYPRLSPRGVIVFDDYGRTTTFGVNKAVDRYFKDRGALIIHNIAAAQLMVVK